MEMTRNEGLKGREFWDWNEMFQERKVGRGTNRWPGRRALQSTLKGHVSEWGMKGRVTNKDRLSFQ